jgi:hypothetical protein
VQTPMRQRQSFETSEASWHDLVLVHGSFVVGTVVGASLFYARVAWYFSRDGSMTATLTKRSVDYKRAPRPDERSCGNCDMSTFPSSVPTGTCDLVLGTISKDAICDRWREK